jgi:molybdopterin molybdotransferase
MLDLKSALEKVISDVEPLASESIAAELALGRVLREPLLATSPIPRLDTSAMDGYALRVADVAAGTILPVIGEARTGLGQLELKPGSAMRIFTGAALPLGADTVVMQERVKRQGDQIVLEAAPKVRDNVRRQGEDLEPGAQALPAGSRVTPGALMLAASLDQSELVVSRRPRVTILCTGDELRAVGAPGGLGTIPESNSPGLRALAERACAQVTIAPLIADAPHLVSDAVTKSLEHCDLLLTVGGVSVGDHDYVRGALEAAGVQLGFWKVAIKPGKPLAFGRLGDRRVLALPGNPASALVTFALFGIPLLRALQKDERPIAFGTHIPCAADVRRNSERLILSLGTLVDQYGTSTFMPHRNQSSGATVALAESDGLALIAAGDSICEKGTLVPFLPWSGL